MELSYCLTYAAKIDTRQTAKYNDDQELLTKIGNYNFRYGPDFTAMEVKYHPQPCKSEYLNKWRSSIKVFQTIFTDKQARKIAKKNII